MIGDISFVTMWTYLLGLQRASCEDEDRHEMVTNVMGIGEDAYDELHHRLQLIDATTDDSLATFFFWLEKSTFVDDDDDEEEAAVHTHLSRRANDCEKKRSRTTTTAKYHWTVTSCMI